MSDFLQTFSCDVFTDKEMKARLPKEVYGKLKKTIEAGTELDPSIADTVANAMKEWALERGATHYTHWFQPLTGVTAEKHDAFLSINKQGKAILDFEGKHLIKGEPDASSFPSGGLRATFEARGYTAWDCTSPAFLREDALGVTLCIPTAFCSYTGESLDQKTPLLRSMQAIDKESLRLVRMFGDDKAKRIIPMVGAEQEYFLVDKDIYNKRKDLIYTGHTLFGAMPPKGQELSDHYYGIINERVGAYMKDINQELWKLGVPAKTQHNEGAPSQHELAPLYEQCNIATDHNQMTMETMKRVAGRHGMVCLLHEKPFAGVNGSGKHNNWSLATDLGRNLLKPGDKPHENLEFLLILTCVIKAVDEHADLIRYSGSNVGNDLRLGGNEAPPAVISVFLGEQLQDILDQFAEKGSATHSLRGGKLKTGVAVLPDFNKDATDRNRTSPFAFTGNKFELRILGSSDSLAMSNIVLNTIVAEAFKDACDELGEHPDQQEIGKYIAKTFKEHRKVVFNGNGYDADWVKEAKKRGLPNLKSMVDAIPCITDKKAVDLFEKFGVFTKSELDSRAEIEFEMYAKEINIEARTMLDIATKQIIPAVVSYIGSLAGAKIAVNTAVPTADTSVQETLVSECSALLAETKKSMDKLQKELDKAAALPSGEKSARAYRYKVFPAMEALRAPVDALEMRVDKACWPMPSYGDIIF
ncbi:MAG: glutamine synthetase III [Lachnospiraceae bacterium]|nr:glutamine synthetase III [Lachnospiraceae bacterium]